MYSSIASVELVSHMQSQFAEIFPAAPDRMTVAPGPVRRLLIAALRTLANHLEPAPITA